MRLAETQIVPPLSPNRRREASPHRREPEILFTPNRERLLDDDRIVGLRAVLSIPKVVSTGEGDAKDWKAYASCLPRLTWLLSGLDEASVAGDRCCDAVEEPSYLQSRLEPKHPESDCVRSMLASMFPSQDCLWLAPLPASARSPTGGILPNEMLPPGYVSGLASLRRRIVSAPRPAAARLVACPGCPPPPRYLFTKQGIVRRFVGAIPCMALTGIRLPLPSRRLPGGGGGVAAVRLSQVCVYPSHPSKASKARPSTKLTSDTRSRRPTWQAGGGPACCTCSLP